MPYKPKAACKANRCPGLTDHKSGYCEAHKAMRYSYDMHRPTANARGYGSEWQKIRAEVLTKAGIPKDQWHLYDVDHRPAYPTLGPDHRQYTLVPMLHGQHSKKTAKYDGSWKRATSYKTNNMERR